MKISQKSALHSFYIVHLAAQKYFRISTAGLGLTPVAQLFVVAEHRTNFLKQISSKQISINFDKHFTSEFEVPAE